MNLLFGKKAEPNADDLGRLAELTERVTALGELFGAQSAALSEKMKVSAKPVVATFDEWKLAASEFLELADRFRLAERHDVRNALKVGEHSIAALRALVEENVDWPAEINERDEQG